MDNSSINPQHFVNASGQYIPQGNGVEISVDTNGDGFVDDIVYSSLDAHTVHVSDTDRDGRFDQIIDCGSAGDASVTAYLDSDNDGTFDMVLEDTDGDGVWDSAMTDTDGDGICDTYGDMA